VGWLFLLVRRSIAIKLTLTLTGFTGLVAIAAGVYLSRALEDFAVDALEARLATAARVMENEARVLLRSGERGGPAQQFAVGAGRSAGLRVTLIARDGVVLAESERAAADLAGLDNHAGRPEVRLALEGRLGREVRRSVTVESPLLYVAHPVRDGARVIGVLRLALPLSAVTSAHATLQQVMLVGGLVALAVAFGIGLFVARRVTRPVVEMQFIARQMSEGRFDVRAAARSPDEIGTLGRSLNVMAARLREKIEDLAREQTRVAAILDGMVEGVIAVDGHDRIVLSNARARAMLGLAPGRGAPRPFLEMVRSADLHRVFREARDVGLGGVVRREVRLTEPGGLILQVHAAPLRLGGDGLGVAMVLHDVTELRRLEHVRTGFIANLSHELRTPLTAIHGSLETLLEGALDDPADARRFLEVVFRHTGRLGRLLDDLTDLSNIELGRISLKLVPVDLADAVESVLEIIEPRAERGKVALTRAIPRDLPPVRADRDRLAQILLNLVDNAVKYTPEGGRVTVRAAVREGATVEVVVGDTGTGIPPADLPRITERFYRVDKARSRELGGTGLGLAIVKHLVAAHGGELRIDSRLGEGTVVAFTLPASAASGARAAEA
jgi:two-component system phosphate regulon sensor histidine kinase PhoR